MERFKSNKLREIIAETDMVRVAQQLEPKEMARIATSLLWRNDEFRHIVEFAFDPLSWVEKSSYDEFIEELIVTFALEDGERFWHNENELTPFIFVAKNVFTMLQAEGCCPEAIVSTIVEMAKMKWGERQ